ncbi:MAG: PhzF family phenazine biosynthesis protein [Pyrinomonadaceae bacterium]
MKLQIFQVDAFTNERFGGNPAAVVPLDAWIADDTMLSIAAENNLAETAFFVKSGDRYDIRWFTPKTEVNLCGHATLATAHVIFDELKLEVGFINFHSHRSGQLGVAKHDRELILDFPAYPMSEVAPIAGFESANAEKFFESQDNMLFVQMATEHDIVSFEPDFAMIKALPYEEVIITAKGETCDFASRMFAPRLGIDEDPVTGAIHCSLIPYWANELNRSTGLYAKQLSARGGELFCDLAGGRVNIGGNAVLFMKGEICVDVAYERSASS